MYTKTRRMNLLMLVLTYPLEVLILLLFSFRHPQFQFSIMLYHSLVLIFCWILIATHAKLTPECYNYLNTSAAENDGIFIISDSDICTNSTITCLEDYYLNLNDTTSYDCNILCTVENSCSNSILECPSYLSNDSNCNIQCIETGSCSGAIVKSHHDNHNNHNNNLNIECDEYESCEGMIVQANDINSVTIECNEIVSCQNIQLTNITNVDSFDLSCNGLNSCFESKINIKNCDTFSLNCTNFQSCSFTNINLSNISTNGMIACSNGACQDSDWLLSDTNDMIMIFTDQNEVSVE